MSAATTVDDATEARVLLLMKLGGGHAVVSPAKACDLLDCGLSRIYRLMDTNELPSLLIGGRRKIAIEHIAKLITRHEAAGGRRVMPWDQDGPGARQYHPRREVAPASESDKRRMAEEETARRRPGRPRKAQPNDKAGR